MALDTDAIDLLGDAAQPQAIGGAFEGASRYDRDLAMWAPALRSADLDILPEKGRMEARTRDIARNDAYVQSGTDINRDGIIGGAYLLNAKPAFKILGLDSEWAEAFSEEVEEKFTLYAESPSNWIDASRMNTLTELLRLAIGVHTISGEILATAEWMRETNRSYATAIQMVDLDRLSNPNGQADDQFMRGGIERNKFGAPVAAHIQMAHPSDYTAGADSYTWKRVPMTKPWGRQQVIHIFEQNRPDQSRGISSMVAALKEMKITKKFRDVTLQNAVVNATYAASIESDLPPEVAMAAMGGGQVDPRAITNYAASYLGAVSEYSGNSRNMHIDGVKIPHFFPGTRLQLRPAGTPGGVGTEFETSLLRYIAASLGVSYEELSRDFSKTNYSSARAAMNNTWKHLSAKKKVVADKMASLAYRLWLEEALNKGTIKSAPKNAVDLWYASPENADALARCEWLGANRGQIDELKETQAAVLRLKYNLSTKEDELGRLGKDWRKVALQRQRENRLDAEYGLVNEESNAINAASGAVQERSAKGTKNDGTSGN